MTLYSLLVFLHVLGAVGMFAAWGIETVALAQLRHAVTTEQVRTGMGLRRGAGPLGPAAMLAALATGVWMMVSRWGYRPWMAAALAGLALIIIVGFSLERRAGLRRVAAADGEQQPSPAAVRGASELLAASLRLRIAIGVGILGLMTVKPDATGAVAMLVGAVLLGLASALAFGRRRAPAAT